MEDVPKATARIIIGLMIVAIVGLVMFVLWIFESKDAFMNP